MTVLTLVLGIIAGVGTIIGAYGVYRQIKATAAAESAKAKDDLDTKVQKAKDEERSRCADVIEQRDRTIVDRDRTIDALTKEKEYLRTRADELQDQINDLLRPKGGS